MSADNYQDGACNSSPDDLFRSIVQQNNAGIAVIDAGGRLVYVNGALADMLVRSLEDLPGQRFFDFVHHQDLPRLQGIFRAGRPGAGHSKASYTEIRLLPKSGGVRHLYVCVTRTSAEGGHVKFNAVFMDISRIKNRENRLVAHNRRLASLASWLPMMEEHERRRMAIYLHDRLAQRLAVCHLRLQNALKMAPSLDDSSNLADITDLLKCMVEDTRQLTLDLDFALLYQFGLQTELEHLASRFRQLYRIRCTLKLADEPHMEDHVRVLLLITVRELMANIARHSGARRASISARTVSRRLELTVEDDGVGFDQTRKQPAAKEGTGLFMVRVLMGFVGGRMEIERRTPTGTRVTLTIPLRDTRMM